MVKHPVLTSFLVAVALALGFAALMLATTRNVDEKPFVIYFTLVAFPFAWFLLWIFLAAIGWWQGILEGPAPGGDADRDAKRGSPD